MGGAERGGGWEGAGGAIGREDKGGQRRGMDGSRLLAGPALKPTATAPGHALAQAALGAERSRFRLAEVGVLQVVVKGGVGARSANPQPAEYERLLRGPRRSFSAVGAAAARAGAREEAEIDVAHHRVRRERLRSAGGGGRGDADGG